MASSEKTQKTEEIQELVKQLKVANSSKSEEIFTQVKRLAEELVKEDVSSNGEKDTQK